MPDQEITTPRASAASAPAATTASTAPALAHTRAGRLILLLVLAVLWFGTIGYRHLVKPDEGRYAEIPREMVVTGDWVTPRLDGYKYFEKPALQYWATATAYEAFGLHEWTARLWPALTGFLGVLLVGLTGRRLFGRTAGLLGAAALASSMLYALIGHINTLDMGVTFFMEAGLCGFLLAQAPQMSARGQRNWMLFTWAALALAVLSKGLMGIVLPGAVLVLYTLVERDWRLWTRLHLGKGLLLFLAIAAPWFVVVCRRNPDFFQFFFIHEHFQRFLTKEAHRYQPWYYFVPILLLGLLPWLVTAFDALIRAWRAAPQTNGFRPQRLLLIWAVFIYVFFSVSDSKLPSYILPIFPALALLVGWRLAMMRPRAIFWQQVPMLLLAAIGLAALGFLPAHLLAHNPDLHRYLVWPRWGLGLWLAATAVALAGLWRQRPAIPYLLLVALGAFAGGQLALLGHETFSGHMSSWQIAREVRPLITPDEPCYSVEMYDQTLPFYLQRTFTLEGFKDELAFGIGREPWKYLPDRAAFTRVWAAQPRACAVMTPTVYGQLAQAGLLMRVLGRDADRVIVAKP